MKVLIIGSNGLLARTFIKENTKNISKLYVTASSAETLSDLNTSENPYSLDFKSKASINDFFANKFDELDLILFCASPFEGTLKGSSFDELNTWSNAYEVAIKIAKLASMKLNANGKLIFIGSVVGYQGSIAASCVPYSVFKGSLSLLVEGYNKEFSKQAIYINLGGFRSEETDDYLSVNQVVSSLNEIIRKKFEKSHIDIVSEKDRENYNL